MTLSQLVELAVERSAVERVLADGLEHREPKLAVGRLAADEAPADERLEVPQELTSGTGDRACVVERSAVGEDRKRAVELALGLGQALVAPVDGRAQRALSLREIDGSLHLECEPFPEGAEDLRRRQHCEPRGDELDRERQAVESTADLVDGCERVVSQDDAAGGSELDEERRRVVDRERLEREDVLGRQTQRRSARREHLKIGCAIEELGNVDRRRA